MGSRPPVRNVPLQPVHKRKNKSAVNEQTSPGKQEQSKSTAVMTQKDGRFVLQKNSGRNRIRRIAASPGRVQIPPWVSGKCADEAFFTLPIVVKHLMLIAVVITGFIVAQIINEYLYYWVFMLMTVLCAYLSFATGKLLIYRCLVAMLCCMTVGYSMLTTVRMTADIWAERASGIADISVAYQQESTYRGPDTKRIPTSEEIARGGKTHDGIPLKQPLYYQGTTRYHADRNCSAVNAQYLPMKNFVLYEELTERKYKAMQPCTICKAPVRPHSH